MKANGHTFLASGSTGYKPQLGTFIFSIRCPVYYTWQQQTYFNNSTIIHRDLEKYRGVGPMEN